MLSLTLPSDLIINKQGMNVQQSGSVVLLLENLLGWEEWAKQDEISAASVAKAAVYIPLVLDLFKRVVDQKTGAMLKLIKFHMPVHFCDNIKGMVSQITMIPTPWKRITRRTPSSPVRKPREIRIRLICKLQSDYPRTLGPKGHVMIWRYSGLGSHPDWWQRRMTQHRQAMMMECAIGVCRVLSLLSRLLIFFCTTPLAVISSVPCHQKE
jgi:hypothetical protein